MEDGGATGGVQCGGGGGGDARAVQMAGGATLGVNAGGGAQRHGIAQLNGERRKERLLGLGGKNNDYIIIFKKKNRP